LFWLNGLLHLNATEKCTSAGFGIMKAGSLEEALCILSAFIDNEDMVYHQNALSSPEIRKTMDLIENEYTRYISLEEAASNAGLSPNYFSKLFKQESGSSFVKYLNRYRIEAAKRLLSETRLFIYEIAQKTGFSDETYFCRIFKKETGYNPSEWRQHNGG
jgi:YesN/AraC family two-component response regulator